MMSKAQKGEELKQRAGVGVEVDSRGVATVCLNNAEKHNAFDDEVIAALTEAFAVLNADSEVRVVVLASTGKSFSAGADLAWMKRMAAYTYEQNLEDAQALAEMLRQLNALSKPTIARVQGAAMGGGVGLVSCCDMAVASTKAWFCLSEVKIGLIPATISPYVIAAIGQHQARRYGMTAERFSAATAKSLGLVSEVVEPEELDRAVASLVDSLLANSPAALTATKQLIHRVSGRPLSADLINETSKAIAAIRVSDEGQEGLGAFLEKRQPNYLS